jgi:hypothetical protein
MRTLADKYQCLRKVQYKTIEEAQKAALRMMQLEKKIMIAYYCGCCGDHHIGTPRNHD